MKLSKRGEQGLKALMKLALEYPGRPLTLKHLSDSTGTSVKFLEQILLLLRRGKFVCSKRGIGGGFQLTRDPRKIVLGDVIRFMEGPLAARGNQKVLQQMMRSEKDYAGLYGTLLDVRDACSGILDNRSVWDLCEMTEELNKTGKGMYYI